MSSVDFAAAQKRVAARRQLREAKAQSRITAQQHLQASYAFSSLPFPLGGLGRKGLQAWNTIKGREGTRPAFRVGQVDAELLDEELLDLLRAQVGDGLKYFDSHLRDDWSSEIFLGLRAILFKLSIWDHDASYGAALQNLRYTDARKPGPLHISPTTWQKAIYGLFTVGGRYGWEKWEAWLIDREGDLQASSNTSLLANMSHIATTAHSIAAFASFLVFLVNGRYRTLLDRVLRMRLAPPSHQITREVSFEYLNRQLVWHAFTEFLLFLLPLVGISRWRRWISRAWRKTKNLARSGGEAEEEDAETGELAFLPERTCGICYHDQNPTSTSENEVMTVSQVSGGVIGSAQTDITNPYETVSCGCIYCFVCIATRLEAEEGEGWVCLRCGELVKECKPWSGDIVERDLAPADQKDISFPDGDGFSNMDRDRKLEKHGNGSIAIDKLNASTLGPPHESDWAEEDTDSAVDVANG